MLILLSTLLVVPSLRTLSPQEDVGAAAPAVPAEQAELPRDPTLAAFQTKLLELAYRAASAIPTNYQLKERSLCQEEVVRACLELGQLRRAEEFMGGIQNWRRGLCAAELAYRCVELGHPGPVARYLESAEDVAKQALADQEQTWRIDSIRAAIAKTHLSMGQVEEAARFDAALDIAVVGDVLATKALYLDAEGFEAQLKNVDAILSAFNFDQLKVALGGLVPVYERFYADTDRRERVEQKILSSWAKLPPDVQLDLALGLAGVAADQGDLERSRTLLEEGRRIVDGFRGEMHLRVPMLARLALARGRAGDAASARREVDAALAEFEQGSADLADFRRPDVLRPIAETYHSLGHADAALMIYKRAIAEGGQNPNLRPRVEDLVSTCCSLALRGIEPDEGMWKQMEELIQGLKSPW
jgi:tetratricopeptide (TPR) repeat protein